MAKKNNRPTWSKSQRAWIAALIRHLTRAHMDEAEVDTVIAEFSDDHGFLPSADDMKTVVVQQRTTDFHASLKGSEKTWDRGTTSAEAIGNLVRTHPKKFRLDVKIVGR